MIPMQYKDYVIPPRTAVGMTPLLVHENADLFEAAKAFKPERWLETDGKLKTGSGKYLFAFGRGTRQCLGMNLGYAELYLTLATLFRTFDMGLYETSLEDIEVFHDFFNGIPKLDSRRLRIRIA